MSDPLPKGVEAIAASIEALGYAKLSDESPSAGFRQIKFAHPQRSFGQMVELVEEHGLWGVEISVEGDFSHGPYDILLALEDREHATRQAGFEELQAITAEALRRMPQTEPGAELMQARLRQYRHDYTRWASGRDRDLTEARQLFRDGDFEQSLALFARLEDHELSRADGKRIEIARQRTTLL